MCGEFQQAKCENEFGDNLEWACERCEQKRAQDLSEYTKKILRIRGLKIAGYPFGKNDLTVEEWEDLGRLEEIMTENEQKRPRPVYLVKIKE